MNRPMKRILIWAGVATTVILLLAGGLFWYLYHSAEQTAAKMYEDIEPTKPVYVSKDTDVKGA